MMELFRNPFHNVYQKLFGQQPDLTQPCDPPIELNIKLDPDLSSSVKSEISERSGGELEGPNEAKTSSNVERDCATQTDLPSLHEVKKSNIEKRDSITQTDSWGLTEAKTSSNEKKDSVTQTDFPLVTLNLKRKATNDDTKQLEKSRKRFKREIKKARKREQSMQRRRGGVLNNFTILEYPNNSPRQVLSRSASTQKVSLRYMWTSQNQGGRECTVLLNNVPLAQAVGRSTKKAKDAAAVIALQELKKYNFTIRASTEGSKLIHRNDFENVSGEQSSDHLGHHNIGHRMITAMGWSDTQGLGKSSQGILQPIIPVQKFKRGGLGSQNDQKQNVFIQKCLNVLESYIREPVLDEVEFCSFTGEEMCLIEYAAQKLGLPTRRLGKVNRGVRVMKMRKTEEKLKFLLASGGLFGNYQLIQPTVLEYCQ